MPPPPSLYNLTCKPDVTGVNTEFIIADNFLFTRYIETVSFHCQFSVKFLVFYKLIIDCRYTVSDIIKYLTLEGLV